QITTPQGTLQVKSSLSKLRETANQYSLDEYAAHCGIAKQTLVKLASTFAKHGRQSAAACHGGMMSGSGFYAAFGITMLNILVGSFNQKGGVIKAPGRFNGVGNGPRYNLDGFPGKRGPKGVFLSRSRFPYEKSSEYQRKVAAGESPYPSRAPWRLLAPPALGAHITSGLGGYPSPIKAV